MFNIDVVISEQDRDCGPACLKMLLDYYGIEEDLSVLSQKCNVGIRGCTMGDIKRVGIEYGLNMHAFETPAADLFGLDHPAIAWWKYNHFVIFAGMDDDGLPVICDPALGRIHMPISSFKAFYSDNTCEHIEP